MTDQIFRWPRETLPATQQVLISQRLQFCGKSSSEDGIGIGVPQGSLLGARLFSILDNDFPGPISTGHLFMYADDTTIYCISKSNEDMVKKLNVAVNKLRFWCTKNHLTVNGGKADFYQILILWDHYKGLCLGLRQ